MASVSAAMAVLPVSGWARICGRLLHDLETLAQEADLVGKLAFAVGKFANGRGQLVDTISQRFLRSGQAVGLAVIVRGQ